MIAIKWMHCRNLSSQTNIFNGHSDGIYSFGIWGKDVISVSGSKIGLSSVSISLGQVNSCFVLVTIKIQKCVCFCLFVETWNNEHRVVLEEEEEEDMRDFFLRNCTQQMVVQETCQFFHPSPFFHSHVYLLLAQKMGIWRFAARFD